MFKIIRTRRILFVALFTALISLLAGCDKKSQGDIDQWPTVENCNLHKGPCTTEHQGAKVTLRIDPQPIPIARPLGVQLDLENLNPTEVKLDISGINMYMGYNRVHLTSTRPNHWVGTSMLAFCTAEKMYWQLTLMLTQNDGKQIQIPFLLETSNRAQ
ncbi:hypothetical protein [Thiomicrorhabdus sp. 6S3-12]|uniref:hypothetical protein n=1 Tax=Thiomicrorhabdus sp. 6S3-12 TaxID=2819681 RepID=UPI001AAD209A|nr:hypothetical protein [Thiomicrorhabdus sp. 6S3-12]MBO1925058.1 hypothetical protein [Thiomicrorhabdus sp. 6S3-12]